MAIEIAELGIEGLTELTDAHRAQVMNGGRFALPPNFPANMASRWEEEGPAIIEAGQEEVLQFAGCKAQGWIPFKVLDVTKIPEQKVGETPKPILVPYKRVIGKKVYVLLMRPKELQIAVNKIYANQSSSLVGREINGESVLANAQEDAGILGEAAIRRFDKITRDEENASSRGLFHGVASKTPAQAVELNLQ
jgi:hypothetical protein